MIVIAQYFRKLYDYFITPPYSHSYDHLLSLFCTYLHSVLPCVTLCTFNVLHFFSCAIQVLSRTSLCLIIFFTVSVSTDFNSGESKVGIYSSRLFYRSKFQLCSLLFELVVMAPEFWTSFLVNLSNVDNNTVARVRVTRTTVYFGIYLLLILH